MNRPSVFAADLQMVCGFSCEDLVSMFKELKGLGVVVKELSNELRQLVRRKPSRPSAFLSVCVSVCVFTLRVCGLWSRSPPVISCPAT